jgi:hypothetical protein
MPLEVVTFEDPKLQYEHPKIKGTYTIVPPVMSIEAKVKNLFAKMGEVVKNNIKIPKTGKKSEIDIEQILNNLSALDDKGVEKEMIDIMVEILHLILVGDVKKITYENIRLDFFQRVTTDFFIQYR